MRAVGFTEKFIGGTVFRLNFTLPPFRNYHWKYALYDLTKEAWNPMENARDLPPTRLQRKRTRTKYGRYRMLTNIRWMDCKLRPDAPLAIHLHSLLFVLFSWLNPERISGLLLQSLERERRVVETEEIEEFNPERLTTLSVLSCSFLRSNGAR